MGWLPPIPCIFVKPHFRSLGPAMPQLALVAVRVDRRNSWCHTTPRPLLCRVAVVTPKGWFKIVSKMDGRKEWNEMKDCYPVCVYIYLSLHLPPCQPDLKDVKSYCSLLSKGINIHSNWIYSRKSCVILMSQSSRTKIQLSNLIVYSVVSEVGIFSPGCVENVWKSTVKTKMETLPKVPTVVISIED